MKCERRILHIVQNDNKGVELVENSGMEKVGDAGRQTVGQPARVTVRPTVRPTVRMDKWLWAARFYKTRALAAKACDLNRVISNGIASKPARDVRVGDVLRIKTEAAEFEVEVLGLSEMRGPSAVAQGLFRETEASREARLKAEAEKKALEGYLPVGRPSKRDRRVINRFRGR